MGDTNSGMREISLLSVCGDHIHYLYVVTSNKLIARMQLIKHVYITQWK